MAKPESTLEVLRTERLAPRLKRVFFGGPGFDDYLAHDVESTDKYVKLHFTDQAGEIRLRTYTVRSVNPAARELAIDFVTHDHGLAGPWALRAQPGETLVARGPGGGYRPQADADHHVFVGDEAALPAIAASLEALQPGARATAFLEVDDADAELALATPGDLEVRWLHRDGAAPGTTTLLDEAVRAWQWPAGRVQAFVHGESALLKTVRPYLLDGRVARADISVSAYWRRGATEEGFRAWKSAQTEAVMRPGT
jgi:NADPH-dependent ferric siderophore reductase